MRRLLTPALASVQTPPVASRKPQRGARPGDFVLWWEVGAAKALVKRVQPGRLGAPTSYEPCVELAVVGGERFPVPAMLETAERVRLVDVEPGLRWSPSLIRGLQHELRKVLSTPVCRVCAGACTTVSTYVPAWSKPCVWCVRGRARFVCERCREALPLCPCVARESIAWQAVADLAAMDPDERGALLRQAAAPGTGWNHVCRRLVERGFIDECGRLTKRGSAVMHALAGPQDEHINAAKEARTA